MRETFDRLGRPFYSWPPPAGTKILRAKINQIRTRGCGRIWSGKQFELRHYHAYLCTIPPRETDAPETLVLIPDYHTIVRGYYDLN